MGTLQKEVSVFGRKIFFSFLGMVIHGGWKRVFGVKFFLFAKWIFEEWFLNHVFEEVKW